MSFGQNETVSSLHIGILGIDIHFFKIQIGKDICCGKGSAGMSCLCTVNCRYNAFSHIIRVLLQF